MDQLLAAWPSAVDNQERTRRLIDLFLVSVLLDAGAGTKWSYRSKESGKVYRRSEGLAVASLEMFKAGFFSSSHTEPCQVDSMGLMRLTVEQLAKGLQVSESNPLMGIEGRAGLLSRLGDVLLNRELFGVTARPGNMIGMLTQTDWSGTSRSESPRLSPLPSDNSSILHPNRNAPNLVGRPDTWPSRNMACNPYSNRQYVTWRCMAIVVNASLSTGSAVGKYCSIS